MKANYIVRFHGKHINSGFCQENGGTKMAGFYVLKDTIDYNIFGDIQKSTELERKTILSYAMC